MTIPFSNFSFSEQVGGNRFTRALRLPRHHSVISVFQFQIFRFFSRRPVLNLFVIFIIGNVLDGRGEFDAAGFSQNCCRNAPARL